MSWSNETGRWKSRKVHENYIELLLGGDGYSYHEHILQCYLWLPDACRRSVLRVPRPWPGVLGLVGPEPVPPMPVGSATPEHQGGQGCGQDDVRNQLEAA